MSLSMSTRAGLPRACRSLCDVPQHRLVKLAHSRGAYVCATRAY